ncbi:hypothetical protein T459_06716 [Capsicum annuum]|uniref:Uncharacterized protein n=1 Tax=Capsicum annuum TaxID=4072 RepID=A0A2G3ABQ3_CAPAN|nr:hypothetical protein T459_06716 [Capsicum annuum]
MIETGSGINGVLPASISRNRSQKLNFSRWFVGFADPLRDGLGHRFYEFFDDVVGTDRDCGLYMVTYAGCLTFGECVPNVDFDSNLLRTRCASMLWHYGSRKEEEKAQSDDEAPMRPLMEIGITKDTEVHDI